MSGWRDFALCRGVDPELFFPERGASLRECRAVCAQCPVRQPCLDYAIEAGEKFGVWGGTSERERRPLRQARFGKGNHEHRFHHLRAVAS